ncbi:sensor histidine kinase [Bradyrhizobium sp. AUGA SZCCT0240]|jgi:two-component sensor histidine kinase|uniref:sensor histidine kinase n=1 Tax=unclassified Bradyrhizobium TaxID=2631580 RepID=UPI001BA480C5|nr:MULTISPECIES: HWE histidine kinase domain-containing protein [unclassified Bradyrhizobium]MBR1189427.1 sensor histidine kinase [Bradyrhizobium sp. AUGA SZCCT0160]MBR1199295.1 sensor histidine kinase [Bradyrhizobium sp. AUGA SZCCT0158]MBR1239880.1 sensor histidine kinase [Bradyrhizobium sp. AUGA SZCCT0274]MBR1248721.1 sensor histidine kinase [Bradyrhizobium sp. AUGA SZCCT0169]MBR1257321.1 sensor histidine kinase [Bradyrhizobium sp. AUGA SZCCT0240]
MTKLIDEFRHGWQGISQPSLLFSTGFAVCCLVLATLARWGLAQIRPDVFFTPYFPAVFFATAFGGFRIGIATALAGGALGVAVNFSDAVTDSARLALLLIFWAVCGITIWGVEHYRTIVAQQRQIAKRLIEEEEYRKLIVEELQHRLKNKTSTIHAVLHQVLHEEPQAWSSIDHRIRALSATDDLIARIDGSGCDIKDLLRSELGPYGHVRFNLNGDPLFLPAKLAVSLALIFHELATNAGKYGAFSAANGMLQVSWTVSDDKLNVAWLKITWDETEGPAVEKIGAPGFGTKLLQSALRSFDGKTEVSFLKTGVHCTMQCRIPAS